jgi:nucleoside-triphosphatase
VDEGIPRLLLEGRPRIGKSTLARRLVTLLHWAGVPVGGFTTGELRTGGRREGFLSRPSPGPGSSWPTSTSRPAPGGQVRGGPGRLRAGRPAGAAHPEDRRGRGVDELGKMELASAAFRDAVLELLGRDVAVVATVHHAWHQLTDALKRRPDVRVVQVTEATRDTLPRQFMERLVGGRTGELP